MYHTNADYKDTVAIFPQVYRMEIDIIFDESTGLDTVTIPPDDIFEAGFDEEMFLNTFCIGSTVEPSFWVRIFNESGKYSENALATAEIRPRMILHNLFGIQQDTVPVGVFHVTKITAQGSDLRLECADRMTYLNRLFEPQGVTSNLYAICRRIASTVGAEFKTTPLSLITGETGNASTGQWITTKSILNAMVDDSIFKGYSYVQVLNCIAEVCGSFAIFDNEGNLELRWFKESDVTLTGDFARSALELNGNTFSMDGNVVQVTGVNVVSEDTELARVGTDKYLLTLNENPIATAMPQTAAEAVLFRMKNTKYIPCRYERIGGDPSVQLGDILTIIDNKERYDEAKADTYDRYSLFLTSRDWYYNGALTENYNASGNPDKDLNTDRGMTVSKRMAQLAKRVTEVEKNITDGMTDYEAALLMFNDKMFNANGLYKTVRTKEDGSIILYFHDETELENSMVIHMFSAAGFAWTTDGWNNGEPLWRYGFTDAGDAILNTINAYILSADIIKTGLLQSQNGASWINMDNGTFCFRSAVPEGMDLDTGKPIYSYKDKLSLDDKGVLRIYGTLKSSQYPNLSISVGKSQNEGYGSLVVSDSDTGDLMSIRSALNASGNGALWSVPMLADKFGTNVKGIYFYPNEISLWNAGKTRVTCDDERAYLTTGMSYISTYKGDVQLSTYSHPYVWINYYKPKYGFTPKAYKFGNGTEGGYADIYASRIGIGYYNNFPEDICVVLNGRVTMGNVANSTYDKSCMQTVVGNQGIYGESYADAHIVWSERAKKENIVEKSTTNALKKLSDIKFYSYDFKKIDETEKDNPVHIEFGTMVEEAPPEIQSSNGKGIDLYSYIGLTTKAVQELSQKVETLEQKIAELEAENQALKQ